MSSSPVLPPCKDFCCSDFANKPSNPENDECNLTNPIHPIFCRQNFSGFTHYQYAELDDTLRLASRCMTLPAFVEYVVTIAEGDTYLIDDNNNLLPNRLTPSNMHLIYSHLSRMARFPKPGQEVVNDELRSKCEQHLSELTSMIQFGTNDKIGGAFTNPAQGPLSQAATSSYPHGILSVIDISPTMLPNDHPSNTDDRSWNYRRSQEFQLACVILHELSHALHLALFGGARTTECFYKDSPLSEAGYDLVARVFGGRNGFRMCRNRGVVDQKYPMPHARDNPLAEPDAEFFQVEGLFPWPYGAGLWYENVFWDFNNMIDCRVPRPTMHGVVVKLEGEYVCGLFREKFWRDVVPSYGMRALMPNNAPRWIITKADLERERREAGLENVHAQDADWDDSQLETTETELTEEEDDDSEGGVPVGEHPGGQRPDQTVPEESQQGEPNTEARFTAVYDVSHLDDWQLSGEAWEQMQDIIMGQEGYQAQQELYEHFGSANAPEAEDELMSDAPEHGVASEGWAPINRESEDVW